MKSKEKYSIKTKHGEHKSGQEGPKCEMLGNSHIDRNVSSSFIVPFKFESNLDI
jgi:hypothetical protein